MGDLPGSFLVSVRVRTKHAEKTRVGLLGQSAILKAVWDVTNDVTKNVTTDAENPDESKKYAYCNNYNGKNPMTRSQWRRYQRSKKGINANADEKVVKPKEKLGESVRRPVKERLYLPSI